MAIYVDMLGRLGNNLFQYAFGRIVAEACGSGLYVMRTISPTLMLPGLDTEPSLALEDVGGEFGDVSLVQRFPGLTENCRRWSVDDGPSWDGHTVDLDEIVDAGRAGSLLLKGYFQQQHYYAPHRDAIRRWYRTDGVLTQWSEFHPSDVVLNVRRGAGFDYLGWTLSGNYYRNVLSKMSNVGQVYVCGTCIDDSFRSSLEEFSPIYYNGPPFAQFIFMQKFNRMILSNSTFAWWSAFLSDATEIYGPRSSEGVAFGFRGFGSVDLHLKDGRYREVEDVELARNEVWLRFKGFDHSRLREWFHNECQCLTLSDQRFEAVELKLIQKIIGSSGRMTLREFERCYAGTDKHRCLRNLLGSGHFEVATEYRA